jgi:hypothetical protein
MADCGIALIGQDLRRGQDERRRQNVGLSIHAWCLQLRLEIRQIAAIVSSPLSSVACNHGVPKRDNVTVPVGCQRETTCKREVRKRATWNCGEGKLARSWEGLPRTGPISGLWKVASSLRPVAFPLLLLVFNSVCLRMI